MSVQNAITKLELRVGLLKVKSAVGAYVPVMTNDPKTLPVPLAFSFPVINLGLGALMVFLVATFSDSILIVVILPLYTLPLVYLCLAISIRALNSYK